MSLPFVVSAETMHRVAGAVAAFTPRFLTLTPHTHGAAYPTHVGRLLLAENALAVEASAERDGLAAPPCSTPLVWHYRRRAASHLEQYRAIDCYLHQIEPDWRRLCPGAVALADLQALVGRAVIHDLPGYDDLPWNLWPGSPDLRSVTG